MSTKRKISLYAFFAVIGIAFLTLVLVNNNPSEKRLSTEREKPYDAIITEIRELEGGQCFIMAEDEQTKYEAFAAKSLGCKVGDKVKIEKISMTTQQAKRGSGMAGSLTPATPGGYVTKIIREE